MKKQYPVFPKTPRNSYGKYTWQSGKYQMEMTHLPGGKKNWRIFEVFQQNAEVEHLKEIFSTTLEKRAKDKWEELTLR